MDTSAIHIEDVSFSYDGEVILDNVSLTVEERDFLGIIGPNGGGKTTLLKLVLGILKPDNGKIHVFGTTPSGASKRIGYVSQNTAVSKEFPISIHDVVALGRLGSGNKRGNTDHDREVVRQSLETVGMWEFRNKRVAMLSGGQRQRVFIARALATEPDILIMDEPTASIDIHGQVEIYALLKSLNRTITIVVVSHDIVMLCGRATGIAHLNKKLYFHPAPEMTREALEKLSGADLEHVCPMELVSSQFFVKKSMERDG